MFVISYHPISVPLRIFCRGAMKFLETKIKSVVKKNEVFEVQLQIFNTRDAPQNIVALMIKIRN